MEELFEITMAYLADKSKVKCRKGIHSPADSPLACWSMARSRRRQVGECYQTGDGVSDELGLGL